MGTCKRDCAGISRKRRIVARGFAGTGDGATPPQTARRICFFGNLGSSSFNPGFARKKMNELLHFVVRHGYTLVFAWVFIEQDGLPVPSAPLLLPEGALAGTHERSL